VIVLLCAVGAFATGNNLFADGTVAAFGVIGYVRERNGHPVAALVLGIVMASMVEQNSSRRSSSRMGTSCRSSAARSPPCWRPARSPH